MWISDRIKSNIASTNDLLFIRKRLFLSCAAFIFADWVKEDTKTEELESVLEQTVRAFLITTITNIFGELLLNLFDGMKQLTYI